MPEAVKQFDLEAHLDESERLFDIYVSYVNAEEGAVYEDDHRSRRERIQDAWQAFISHIADGCEATHNLAIDVKTDIFEFSTKVAMTEDEAIVLRDNVIFELASRVLKLRQIQAANPVSAPSHEAAAIAAKVAGAADAATATDDDDAVDSVG